jgi:hypothetical protein
MRKQCGGTRVQTNRISDDVSSELRGWKKRKKTGGGPRAQ